jgi:predicted ATPase
LLLAEQLGKAGQREEAIGLLNEALAWVEATEGRRFEAELHRLRGQLRLAQAPADPSAQAEAEASFRQAIAIARRQEAKLFELRAAVGLAQLFQGQGRTAEARRTLAEVYAWFTEGFDTRDLQQARTLLRELADKDSPRSGEGGAWPRSSGKGG